jgi:hypothetical protein
MKKLPILVFFFVAVAAAVAIAAIPPAKSVVGNWKVTYKDGSTLLMHAHANGTFKAEIPSQHFIVSGKYKFSGNTLTINDTSCNAAYWGSYKLAFHGTDSIWSEVIEDSCSPRRSSADKVFLVRQH